MESGSVPVPDPTKLTTEALDRALVIVQATLEAQGAVLTEQITHQREHVDDKVRACNQAIDALKEMRDAKFAEVDRQLRQSEHMRIEQKGDTRAAVDAALTAQKEAISKSEVAVGKQLEQLSETFRTGFDGIKREVAIVRERVVAIEQQKEGAQGANASLYAVAAFLVAVIIIAATLAAAIH